MAASDVITTAREILADTNGDRWSDSRLIGLLNDGVKDLILNAEVRKETIILELDKNFTTFDVSASLLKILRVQYNDEALPLLSHDQMDKKYGAWAADTSEDELKAIVYDLQNSGMFRIYPKLTDGTSQEQYNKLYGILISLDISYDPVYFNIDSIPVNAKYLSIFGVPRPTKIVDLVDDIPLDEQYYHALVYYVTGQALRADMDAANRSFGNEQLGFYAQALAQIKADRGSSSVRSSDLTTDYRRT